MYEWGVAMLDEAMAFRLPDPGVRALYTRDARWQLFLDVEAALAQAQADVGVVPQAAADEIARKAKLELLDRERLAANFQRAAHPLVPIIWELDRICEPEAAAWLHWGATTQNISQTAWLLQAQGAHRIFLSLLAQILAALADLAERTAETALPGRTHGQHAVPTTFGFKVGVWIDELRRHVVRLREAEPRVFVAMMGGAAGTSASLGEKGPAIQARMAERLGLQSMSLPARTLNDHMAEYVLLLGMLAATSGKIASETYRLMKQEFGEVEEPVPDGTVGSSTMPQKRNPKLAQDIRAAAAHVRAIAPLALEAMQTEHEGDRSNMMMMRGALEDACILMGDILQRLLILTTELRVFPERMRTNLDLSGGLIMSEAVMLELGRTMGRQQAHHVVSQAAQAAATSDDSFRDVLARDPVVREQLSDTQIDALLDPERYLGLSTTVAREQAALARETAAEIGAMTGVIVGATDARWN
jgi:3-carboxy-cis,cis-muconate cycloisomerase